MPGGPEDAEEQPSTWEGYEVVHTETPRRVSAPAAPRPEHASSVPAGVLTLSEGALRPAPPAPGSGSGALTRVGAGRAQRDTREMLEQNARVLEAHQHLADEHPEHHANQNARGAAYPSPPPPLVLSGHAASLTPY